MERVYDGSVAAYAYGQSTWQDELRERARQRRFDVVIARLREGKASCWLCGRQNLTTTTGRVGIGLAPVCDPACPPPMPRQRAPRHW